MVLETKKLVRDRIPEIIKSDGRVPLIHFANDSEYWEKLREKLSEEVNEFLKDENKEEIADILEVIHTICAFKSINFNELEEFRKKKSNDYGSFKNKIILDGIK